MTKKNLSSEQCHLLVGKAYQQTVEQVLANKQSQASGLDRAEAQARLHQYGP